jgi:hypothetical protein
MMRLLLPLLVAFVVASGGASGIVLLRANKAAAMSADLGAAVRHDSASAKAVAHSPAAPVGPADGDSSTSAPVTATLPPPAARPIATPITTPIATAAATTVAQPAVAKTSSTVPAAGARLLSTPGIFVGGRISKIFAAMPAKEAAKILGQMQDSDVVVILGSVNDRKAAEILSLLPAPRAASISKTVIPSRLVDK